MKQKDFLLILVPAFIITILWVLFSIYHSYVTSTIKDPLTYQIIPIEGSFNTQGLQRIKERKNFTPDYNIQGESGSPITTPSITLTPEESIISNSENISPSPEPTSASQELNQTQSPTPTDEIILDEGE